MNNRTELKTSIGSTLDFKNTYQYDPLQRLTDLVEQGQSGGNTVLAKHLTFAYNALSQRTQIARYQSTGTSNAVATTDFTYDSANRLSGIAHKQGSTNLDTYAYTYDPLSRIASIVSTLEGTDTYSYDQTSQLVGATHTSQAKETYGFDANGNRNTTGFTTGTNNQTTAGLGFTYTFDDEGNRTSKTETASSDSGPEFVADAIREGLKPLHIETLYIEPGSPRQTAMRRASIAVSETSFWPLRSSRP
ncbi:MAG: hypothetical protein ACK5OB_07010 [Pirellula sp.]